MSAALDKTVAAICLWREDRGAGREGMRAVCFVVRNRALAARRSWYGVVTKPWQFSSMTADHDPQLGLYPAENDPRFLAAQQVVEDVYEGKDQDDPTHGATHYFAPTIPKPQWAASMRHVATIGGHEFYA